MGGGSYLNRILQAILSPAYTHVEAGWVLTSDVAVYCAVHICETVEWRAGSIKLAIGRARNRCNQHEYCSYE